MPFFLLFLVVIVLLVLGVTLFYYWLRVDSRRRK